jgi:hypothetical protein
MTKRLLRRVATGLIGLLIFAQASVTLAGCPMDRGMLSLTIGTGQGEPCGDCGTSVSEFGSLYANRCLSHCTADLQLSGLPVALVPYPVYALAFVLEPPAVNFGLAALHDPPLQEVPRRILLHSYLI